jgi:hypothetical protein
MRWLLSAPLKAHWFLFSQDSCGNCHLLESGVQYTSPKLGTGMIYRRHLQPLSPETSKVTGGGKLLELMYILYKLAYSACSPI